ncbi:hypothetical protein [Flavobacterium sp. 3HN19-14]|uniref:hypothetical protein n=1 Tax=Flavobacterium sp. 3HN19-14 TaxID=3448133 RepID=UPI003EE021AD
MGMNTGVTQRMRYKVDGERVVDKTRQNFNATKFVYGLSGYIGMGSTSLYIRYDLNPLFKNAEKEQHNISAGLRFDF